MGKRMGGPSLVFIAGVVARGWVRVVSIDIITRQLVLDKRTDRQRGLGTRGTGEKNTGERERARGRNRTRKQIIACTVHTRERKYIALVFAIFSHISSCVLLENK